MITEAQFISEQFDPSASGGVKLAKLTADALRLGFRTPSLQKKLFSLCADPVVQRGWSNWTEVSEREEIRLRLLALNTSEKIDESLIPFLIFFFRSSDSLLYQTAAQIIGKQLPYHDRLREFFNEYLQKRKINVSKPLELNGLRGRRRILVALAASYGDKLTGHGLIKSATGEPSFIDLPLDYDMLKEHPPENSLDLSATMLALSVVLKKDKSARAKAAASALLELPGTKEVKIWDRNVIRNWGILLSSAPHSEQEKRDYCRRFIINGLIHIRASESYYDRLQALFELDEIIKSAVFVPGSDKILNDLHIDAAIEPELPVFCKLRFNQWMLRDTENNAPFTFEDATSQQVTCMVAQTGLTENGEYQSETAAELLRPLASEPQWRLQSMTERASRSFFLLDFAVNHHYIQSDEIRQMMTVIEPFAEGRYSTEYKWGGPIYERSVLDQITQRLLNLEQTAKGHIPDGRLIQKISDENLLLALLPTATDSELLPVVADAFEHKLRLLLASGSGFNPDHYIYKISIREPHQKFYRYMKELTAERPYGAPNEPSVDLNSRFDLLYHQDHTKNGNIKTDGLANTPSFWASVHALRNRISKSIENDDLFRLLEDFCHELEGTGLDAMGNSATFHDLINITQQGAPAWFRSGYPATWSLQPASMNQKLSMLQKQIRADIEKLTPSSLDEISHAGEASQRINEMVREAEKLLCPSLGRSERILFSQLSDHIRTLLNRWILALSSAGSKWNSDRAVHAKSAGQTSRKELFSLICTEQNSSLKLKLLSIMLSSMFGKVDLSNQKSWFAQYQVLVWAAQRQSSGLLSANEQQAWRSYLVEYWIEMLQSAKEGNHEARVVQLVKADELEGLRQDESIQHVLRDLKTWCFDRYDMNHAYICNRELNPERNTLQNRWKTAREYFTHFSYVWLAIIVGVIMMFDFGDPWTELAEIGDVGGVLFTFILGVGGTYLYVFANLRKKVKLVKGDPFVWASQFGRVALFLVMTLFFTVFLVLLFYFMFSNTEQVVEGPNAILHIMSWTGFALFVGVFFGLIGKSN